MINGERQGYIEKSFRIPVDASRPGSYWIISLARNSELPSDEELKQLRSYQEFSVRRTYAESYQEVVLKRELPYDSGHNTVIFKKSGQRGWLFRRLSWESPLFIPSLTENERPLALVEIMDKNENSNPDKWNEWKRGHSEIFPPTPDTTPPAE